MKEEFERERSGFEIKNKKYQILAKNNLKEEFERERSGFEREKIKKIQKWKGGIRKK